jgi:hypothetical protein
MPGGQHGQEPRARTGTWRVARATSRRLGELPSSGRGTSGRCGTSRCVWVGPDAEAGAARRRQPDNISQCPCSNVKISKNLNTSAQSGG